MRLSVFLLTQLSDPQLNGACSGPASLCMYIYAYSVLCMLMDATNPFSACKCTVCLSILSPCMYVYCISIPLCMYNMHIFFFPLFSSQQYLIHQYKHYEAL